jgi:hypothetical protein
MDFESSTIAYSFVGFDGGAVTKIANPHRHRNKHKCYCGSNGKRRRSTVGSAIVMASADFQHRN